MFYSVRIKAEQYYYPPGILVKMEDERKVPLLKKVYYEDCPGCRIEKRKDTDDRIPWKMLVSIWIIVLGNGMS